MKNKVYQGEWAGCSDFQERKKELELNHKKFLEMLANGWQVKNAEVIKSKRPRMKIQKTPKAVVIQLYGGRSLTISFEDYKKKAADFKIIMKIY